MSVVRKHFWIDVSRGPGGCCWPRKYGLNGCIPAVVRSTDGSRVAGTSEADGTATCPREVKWSVKLLAIARESIMAAAVYRRDSRVNWLFDAGRGRHRRPRAPDTPGQRAGRAARRLPRHRAERRDPRDGARADHPGGLREPRAQRGRGLGRRRRE